MDQINFYGVIEAFRQGRMPDNHQIDETLQYLLKSSPVDETKLSQDGRKLVQDSREIIETARIIVNEKNADELFQNFIWNTRDVSFDNVKTDPGAVAPDHPKMDEDRQTGACASMICLKKYLMQSMQCTASRSPSAHYSFPYPHQFRSSQVTF